MRNKFIAGLLVGALMTMVVVVVSFIIIRVKDNNLSSKPSSENTSGVQKEVQNNGSDGTQVTPTPDNQQGNTGNDTDNANAETDSLFTHKKGKSGLTDEEQRSLFDSKLSMLMTYIDQLFYDEVDDEILYDGMLHGLLLSLNDPYSVYYSPEEYEELKQVDSGSYCGIGIVASQNRETLVMKVTNVYLNSPAHRAGMLPGDIIVGVNGIDVRGWSLDDVVDMMKGEEGRALSIIVSREGESDYVTFNLVTERIEITYVTSEMKDNNIGYVLVSQFTENADEQFIAAVDKLLGEGMEGLIVDLRDNPGGGLVSVTNMLDRILPKDSLLIYTEDKKGNKQYTNAKSDRTLDIPIVVLVNGESASASELFAGALQDYEKAVIVGTNTFGKGIVQWVVPIRIDNSGIRITVEKYFTPMGRCIHKTGIKPDVEVELDESQATVLKQLRGEKDNQLNKALEEIQKLIKESK